MTLDEGVFRLNEEEPLQAVEIPSGRVSQHLAITSVLAKMKEGGSDPIDKDGAAESVLVGVFLPRKV